MRAHHADTIGKDQDGDGCAYGDRASDRRHGNVNQDAHADHDLHAINHDDGHTHLYAEFDMDTARSGASVDTNDE